MVSLSGIRLMYGATVAGAGSFGIIHILHPQVFTKFLGAPSNTEYIYSDGFIGAAFLGFAYMSFKALKKGTDEALIEFLPVLKLQVYYKIFWAAAFIWKATTGKLELTQWNMMYFGIMSSFIVGDMIAFHSGEKIEDKKKKK